MTRQMAFFIAAVSLGTAAVSCAAAVWLTNDLRAFGLGIIPAGGLAAALVWYFEHRRRPAGPRGHSNTASVRACYVSSVDPPRGLSAMSAGQRLRPAVARDPPRAGT
jgi:hypothetical protein